MNIYVLGLEGDAFYNDVRSSLLKILLDFGVFPKWDKIIVPPIEKQQEGFRYNSEVTCLDSSCRCGTRMINQMMLVFPHLS